MENNKLLGKIANSIKDAINVVKRKVLSLLGREVIDKEQDKLDNIVDYKNKELNKKKQRMIGITVLVCLIVGGALGGQQRIR